MDDREQQRKVRHRLAVLRHAEEVSGNVAATCRYYGISRQVFYKWRRRFEAGGEEGLREFCEIKVISTVYPGSPS